MDQPSADWLLDRVGLAPGGVADWGRPVLDHRPGVYIISLLQAASGPPRVVYIGRSKHLARRLRQFFRHRYGASSPHRGGQEILTLSGQKTVHWAPTEAYVDAERRLLEAFYEQCGAWPLGNRIRSARTKPVTQRR